MKKYFLLLSLALLSFTQQHGEPVDKIGVKGPLSFNNTVFYLAWVNQPTATYYVQEYLPTGETVENFKQMLTVHLLDQNLPVKAAVQQKVKELVDRKKTDPTCNYQVNESPDGKEYMVDCLLGESKNDQMTIAEFIVYHYRQAELGNGRKGIVLYSYSRRAYGEAITAFYKALPAERADLLNAMISTEIPSVTLIAK
jgi:hypothetical protein